MRDNTQHHITHMDTGTAPGRTGITNAMMHSLPESILRDSYSILQKKKRPNRRPHVVILPSDVLHLDSPSEGPISQLPQIHHAPSKWFGMC